MLKISFFTICVAVIVCSTDVKCDQISKTLTDYFAYEANDLISRFLLEKSKSLRDRWTTYLVKRRALLQYVLRKLPFSDNADRWSISNGHKDFIEIQINSINWALELFKSHPRDFITNLGEYGVKSLENMRKLSKYFATRFRTCNNWCFKQKHLSLVDESEIPIVDGTHDIQYIGIENEKSHGKYRKCSIPCDVYDCLGEQYANENLSMLSYSVAEIENIGNAIKLLAKNPEKVSTDYMITYQRTLRKVAGSDPPRKFHDLIFEPLINFALRG